MCVSLPMQHYKGVKYGFVSPYDLANCDVVLVSYETLSLELNYAKSHEGTVPHYIMLAYIVYSSHTLCHTLKLGICMYVYTCTYQFFA